MMCAYLMKIFQTCIMSSQFKSILYYLVFFLTLTKIQSVTNFMFFKSSAFEETYSVNMMALEKKNNYTLTLYRKYYTMVLTFQNTVHLSVEFSFSLCNNTSWFCVWLASQRTMVPILKLIPILLQKKIIQ